MIGFGAGASKLDTQVEVYQYSGGTPAQLLNFTTHAESGKMPGAAVTMGVSGAKVYRSAMGFLADSTAKQIVAYFSQYAANQGWITQDQPQKVKYDENAQSPQAAQ